MIVTSPPSLDPALHKAWSGVTLTVYRLYLVQTWKRCLTLLFGLVTIELLEVTIGPLTVTLTVDHIMSLDINLGSP